MSKKLQKQLNRDLKTGCNADREIETTYLYQFTDDVMQRVEQRRKELYKKCGGIYTQGYLAKRVGIARMTYSTYINNTSITIKLTMLKKMADVLECDITDFFK